MGYQSKKSGLAESWMKESSFISELEKVIPGNVIEKNPNLVYQLRNAIIDNYVLIDKTEIFKGISQTISLIFPEVKRGDLITAELMNKIMRAIENLDARVKVLESSVVSPGAPVITGLSPSGMFRLGDTLTVFGRNFDYSIGAHRVYIDSIRIKSFGSGLSDERLIFKIPDNIQDVTEQGRKVTLQISNRILSTSTDIVVYPIQFPLQGNVEVGFQSVTPEKLEANKDATFKYKVKSLANQIASFEIKAEISGVQNQEEWQNKLKILDDAENQVSNGQIRLVPQKEAFFNIRITSIPSNPPNATFKFTVRVVALGVTCPPDQRTFKVGETAEQQDENIELSYFSVAPPSAYENGRIKVKEGEYAKVTYRAEFLKAGIYDISTKILSGSNWSIEILQTTTMDSYEITEQDLEEVSTRQKLLDFIVRANSGASAAGKMWISIKRRSATKSRSSEMDLARI